LERLLYLLAGHLDLKRVHVLSEIAKSKRCDEDTIRDESEMSSKRWLRENGERVREAAKKLEIGGFIAQRTGFVPPFSSFRDRKSQ